MDPLLISALIALALLFSTTLSAARSVDERAVAMRFKAFVATITCLVLDHDDEVTNVNAHAFGCPCYDCGSHGEVVRTCRRCKRERSRIELIC